MYTNSEIIEGFVHNKPEIVKYVYKTQFPIINAWVNRNKGSIHDTEDIIQEAFLILIRKLKTEKILLNCSLSTFLFSICKHLWFQELRHKTKIQLHDMGDFSELTEDEAQTELKERKFRIFLKNVRLLEEKCRKLFLLYSEKKSLPEIMRIMGFKNTQAVADKKKNCRKILIKKLINSKEYKELESEILIKG